MKTRPTARGWALVAVALAAYLAARVLGTWELYLLSFSFLAAVCVSAGLAWTAGGKLEVTREIVPLQPKAGDSLRVSVGVENGSMLPGLQVTVDDALGDLAGEASRVEFESLGSYARRTVTRATPPAWRGVHHLPALRTRAEDPLGIVRTRRRFGAPLELTIYPRLAKLSDCPLYTDAGVQTRAGRRAFATLGAGEFRCIRPHHPGEPISRVDWKATAKTGSMMLRELEDPTSGDVVVVLDGAAARVVGDAPDSNFELAVQAAGSVADFALRSGRRVSVLQPGRGWSRARLAPGAKGRLRLLEILARSRTHAVADIGPSLLALLQDGKVPTQAVTLVTLSLDDGLAGTLFGLRDRGLNVSVIAIAAESFTSSSPAADRHRHRHALASAGIPCLTICRGDDLGSVLSFQRRDRRRAPVR